MPKDSDILFASIMIIHGKESGEHEVFQVKFPWTQSGIKLMGETCKDLVKNKKVTPDEIIPAVRHVYSRIAENPLMSEEDYEEESQKVANAVDPASMYDAETFYLKPHSKGADE